MSFTYNNGVPAANNNPSVDQPDMLTNAQSINSIIAVDHISFNVTNGGTHKQITFNDVAAPGAQTNPQSILYTVAGAASTISDMRFKNQNGVFPVNLLRAYGVFDGAGNIIGSQSINLASVVRNSAGAYTITLLANVTTGTSYGILITPSTNIAAPAGRLFYGYTITGVTTFTIAFTDVNGVQRDPTATTFVVYQI